MSRRGYIVRPRGYYDDPIFKDTRSPALCRRAAMDWLLERARWKDGLEDVGGKSLMIPRGSLCCSYRYLADAWGWNLAKVQRYVEILKTHKRIDTSTTDNRLIISICNYDEITRIGGADSSATDTANDTRTDTRTDTNKKESKKQDKKEDSPPTPSRSRGSRSAPIDTDPEEARWRMRIKSYRNSGHWDQEWGPEPNKAGCLAPSDVIAEYYASLSPHDKFWLAAKEIDRQLSREKDYTGPTLDLVGEPVAGTTEASVTPLTTATTKKPTATTAKKRRAG